MRTQNPNRTATPSPLKIRLYLVAASGYTSAKRGNPFWSRKQAMAAVVAASKL